MNMNVHQTDPLDPQRQPSTPFKFSPEDQRLLHECNRESFYKRSVPYAAGLGSLVFLATRAGYLRPHASWGPAPKVVAAAFLGYFMGKLSYQSVCVEKFMANPNSQIGAALRARRRQGGGGFQDTLTLDLPGLAIPEESAAKVYRDDLTHGTFTDLDTDRPYQGLDDYQAGFNSPQQPEDFVLPPQATTPNSYEDMRRKNREDHESKYRGASSNRPQEDPQRQHQYPPYQPPTSNPESYRYKSTNVYGDTFDK